MAMPRNTQPKKDIPTDQGAILINLIEDTEGIHRAIYGFNSTPGLLSRMIQLEEMMKDIKKFVWVGITILAGIFVTAVINLILTHPLP